jgi:hypothetical protein
MTKRKEEEGEEEMEREKHIENYFYYGKIHQCPYHNKSERDVKRTKTYLLLHCILF